MMLQGIGHHPQAEVKEKFSQSGAKANKTRGFFHLGLKSLCQALSKAAHGAGHTLCPLLPDKSSPPDLVFYRNSLNFKSAHVSFLDGPGHLIPIGLFIIRKLFSFPFNIIRV